ncbi:MAG: hypothetical protein ACE5GW_01150 [Planctomycetota bacterium]
MEILALGFGRIAGAARLHPRFNETTDLLALRLQVSLPEPLCATLLPTSAERLAAFLSTLPRHDCCGRKAGGLDLMSADTTHAARGADAVAWVGHVVEHAIIDRVVTITDIPSCSGATGALIEPEDQLDIFVSCPDRAVGRLTAELAVEMVRAALCGSASDPLWSVTTRLARSFYGRPGALIEPEREPERADETPEILEAAFALLEGTGFLQRVPFSLNLSGLERYRHLRDAVTAERA